MFNNLLTTDKRKKAAAIIFILVFITFFAVLAWKIGLPMVKFAADSTRFRTWVDNNIVLSRIGFVAMMAFQVVVAIVPGEPLEIGAGYAFGAWQGTILCLAGVFIGSAIIFFMVRKFGIALVNVFFKDKELEKIKFLQDTEKTKLLIFIIFFIPGTPKDMLSYFAPLTKIGFPSWLIISTVARIPSVATSTIGGSALGSKNYMTAIFVFAITAVISVVGIFIYNMICKRYEKEKKPDGNA